MCAPTVPTEATSLLRARPPSDGAPSPSGDAPASSSSGGLLSVTASALIFGVVAALVKLVGMDPYVVLQVRDTLQWLFSLVAVSALLPGASVADRLFGPPRHRLVLFLRSLLYWGFMSLYWNALASMPVGDATALVYCSPVFTALFGWLLLGEPATPRVFGCVALSLVGVGLITQPTFIFGRWTEHTAIVSAQYNRGMLYALGSAAVGGLLPVLVRQSQECHWATVCHFAALCSCAVFTPATLVARLAWEHGAAPSTGLGMWDGTQDLQKMVLLGVMAVVSFVGLGLQTYGYQREQVARASATNFLEIPFSYLLQYLMFGDLLAPLQGLGMLVVVASGLVNLYPISSSESSRQNEEWVPFSTSPTHTSLSIRCVQRFKSDELGYVVAVEQDNESV